MRFMSVSTCDGCDESNPGLALSIVAEALSYGPPTREDYVQAQRLLNNGVTQVCPLGSPGCRKVSALLLRDNCQEPILVSAGSVILDEDNETYGFEPESPFFTLRRFAFANLPAFLVGALVPQPVNPRGELAFSY